MQRTDIPLEPARTIQCTVQLASWTPEGLARGQITTDADEQLPAGTFVEVLGGIPGELVEVSISFLAIWRPKQRKHPKAPIVRLIKVLQSSPDRTAHLCSVFGDCGGCRLQHLPYPQQLQWKQDRVRQTFSDNGIIDALVLAPIGMTDPWHFRNQMRFAINRDGVAGLTAYGTHRVIPLQHCPIAHNRINDTLVITQESPQPRPQLLLRCGHYTDEVLMQPAPDAATLTRLHHAGVDLHTDQFHERLLGLDFSIRPSSFFQTNTIQAEVMAQIVLNALPSTTNITVADAYCGVGTFAAILATKATKVIAIEESASAVKDARANMERLQIHNVEVLLGKTEHLLPTLTDTLDVVVLDPPRMGCMPDVISALRTRQVTRIIYISCDPATLARDAASLCSENVYQLTSVQPLDMFPQTHHIECIAIFDNTIPEDRSLLEDNT